MLLGHLDTVWDLGTLRRRPVRVEDGRLFGAGSFDMKGGIVVLLYALKAMRASAAAGDSGFPLPVTVFLTPLEEVGCEPYRDVMESSMGSCAAVLDFEPAWPGGAFKTQRKGSTTLTLRARGVAAHAGADFARGANAILELSRRLLDAAALTDLESGITLNVGTVRGGSRPNVVPDEAEAQIDVRFRALRDGERACEGVERLRLASSDARIRLEVERGPFYPPLERTAVLVFVSIAGLAHLFVQVFIESILDACFRVIGRDRFGLTAALLGFSPADARHEPTAEAASVFRNGMQMQVR